MISDAFNGNNIWQKCAKIRCSVQELYPKPRAKILAEMLVKQKNIFCAFYFILVTVAHRVIGW
jgi:hypothetical protein